MNKFRVGDIIVNNNTEVDNNPGTVEGAHSSFYIIKWKYNAKPDRYSIEMSEASWKLLKRRCSDTKLGKILYK